MKKRTKHCFAHFPTNSFHCMPIFIMISVNNYGEKTKIIVSPPAILDFMTLATVSSVCDKLHTLRRHTDEETYSIMFSFGCILNFFCVKNTQIFRHQFRFYERKNIHNVKKFLVFVARIICTTYFIQYW